VKHCVFFDKELYQQSDDRLYDKLPYEIINEYEHDQPHRCHQRYDSSQKETALYTSLQLTCTALSSVTSPALTSTGDAASPNCGICDTAD